MLTKDIEPNILRTMFLVCYVYCLLNYLKQVLPVDTFESFLCSNIFSKAVFCLEEKQGILVNDKCSSWYIRVGDFYWQLAMGWYMRQNKTTLLQCVK